MKQVITEKKNSHTLSLSTEVNLAHPSLCRMLKAFLSYTWLIFLAHKKGSSQKTFLWNKHLYKHFYHIFKQSTDSYQLNRKDPLFWDHLCDFLLIIHHLGANMASASSNNKCWNCDNIWLLVSPKESCIYRKIACLWGYLFCSAWRGEASWQPASPHREFGLVLSSALRWQQQGRRELHGAASGYSTKPAGIQ